MVIQVIVGAVLVVLGIIASIGLPLFIVNLEQRPIRERARVAEEEIRKEFESMHLRESARASEDEIRKELSSLHHHDVGSNSEASVEDPHLITP
jgi:hypothetical protein